MKYLKNLSFSDEAKRSFVEKHRGRDIIIIFMYIYFVDSFITSCKSVFSIVLCTPTSRILIVTSKSIFSIFISVIFFLTKFL